MIIDHGTWSIYTPAAPKIAAPPGQTIMYAQRDGPGFGEDWYDYVAGQAFGDASVVMTVQTTSAGDVIQVATFDPTEIFPGGMRVIEETQYTGNDPQGDFGGTTYNTDLRKAGGSKFVWPEPPDSRAAQLREAVARLAERIRQLEETCRS
jgi:hypothetical protein